MKHRYTYAIPMWHLCVFQVKILKTVFGLTTEGDGEKKYKKYRRIPMCLIGSFLRQRLLFGIAVNKPHD